MQMEMYFCQIKTFFLNYLFDLIKLNAQIFSASIENMVIYLNIHILKIKAAFPDELGRGDLWALCLGSEVRGQNRSRHAVHTVQQTLQVSRRLRVQHIDTSDERFDSFFSGLVLDESLGSISSALGLFDAFGVKPAVDS